MPNKIEYSKLHAALVHWTLSLIIPESPLKTDLITQADTNLQGTQKQRKEGRKCFI